VLRGLALPHGEVQRGAAEGGGEVRAEGCEAGGVEERCDGARAFGGEGGLRGVAGVVLGAAADGDVLEGEACCGGWEVGGAWEGGC
jgi:hypothetical protein